jgi:membrane fusion protein, heavy metal efflux system
LQEEYLSLQPKITYAEQELQRQQELNAGNAGALKNLQQAENELASLRTRRASLRQQIGLMGLDADKLSAGNLVTNLSVRAPVGGTVSQIMVKIGSYIDQNTPVAEIVDNKQLHLDMFVYEQDLPKLKINQVIHFTLTNNPGTEYDALIYSIGTAFEQNTKTIPVHARVQGRSDGLIEGMNITGLVSLGKAEVPAVSSEAIVSHEGQDFVFIQTDAAMKPEHHEEEHEHEHEEGEKHDHGTGEKHEEENQVVYQKIPVRRGTTEVGYTEITALEELPANAKVVTKGAFFLLAKMNSKGEEGHAH